MAARAIADAQQATGRAIDAGTMHPVAAADMRTRVVEIEAQLRLAQQEFMIVRRELERRAP